MPCRTVKIPGDVSDDPDNGGDNGDNGDNGGGGSDPPIPDPEPPTPLPGPTPPEDGGIEEKIKENALPIAIGVGAIAYLSTRE